MGPPERSEMFGIVWSQATKALLCRRFAPTRLSFCAGEAGDYGRLVRYYEPVVEIQRCFSPFPPPTTTSHSSCLCFAFGWPTSTFQLAYCLPSLDVFISLSRPQIMMRNILLSTLLLSTSFVSGLAIKRAGTYFKGGR